MPLTEYKNLVRDVGSSQVTHGSGQSCSGSPAADTGVKHFCGVKEVQCMVRSNAPSHEQHLNVEIVRIT